MSHSLDLDGSGTHLQTNRHKKPIKTPFNINFDDNPSSIESSGVDYTYITSNSASNSQTGGSIEVDYSYITSNSASSSQTGVSHRNISESPFSNNDKNLTGVISLDDKQRPSAPTKVFNPASLHAQTSPSNPSNSAGAPTQYDENDDPPLLEDLGIDLQNIKEKTKAVIMFKKCDKELLESADMSGPILFALVFGTFLLLNGKIEFGYIYGFSLSGSLLIYIIMNLLSQEKTLKLYDIVSILGYGLIPVVILAAFAILFPLKNIVGFLLSFGAVIWASLTASSMVEGSLQLSGQKWLIGYPIFLFYLVFVILAVF